MSDSAERAARRIADEGEMTFAAEYDFYQWLYSLPVIYERESAQPKGEGKQ